MIVYIAKRKTKYPLIAVAGVTISFLTLPTTAQPPSETQLDYTIPYSRPPEMLESVFVEAKSEEAIAIKGLCWQTYLETLDVPTEAKDWVKAIVRCESRGNPQAVNKTEIVKDGKSYGHATGLGQFLPSTWKRGEDKYLNRKADIWNEYDQVDMLLAFYFNGRRTEWSCNPKTK